jgi:predicted NBD/HSP70 family sugar kinase
VHLVEPRAQAHAFADPRRVAGVGAGDEARLASRQLGSAERGGVGAQLLDHLHALVLGVDVGARFLRGALCDLTGVTRARHDVEMPVVDAGTVLEAVTGLRDALVRAAGLPGDLIDGAVVGVPGVVDAESGLVGLADNVPGLEGTAFGDELEVQLGLPAQVENDINLAALGEQWRGVARGVDSVFVNRARPARSA